MAVAPPAKGMTPQQYYIELVRQGVRNTDAYAAVGQYFGPPKSKQQQEKDAQSAKQKGDIAAGVGTIGGLVAGRYIVNNAGKWWDKLLGKEVTEEVVKTAAEQTGSTVGGAAAQAGSGLPNVDANFDWKTPDFKLSGETKTVNTSSGPKEIPVEMPEDPGFLDSVNWGKVGQGAAGALQLYSAYKAFQSGDKVGAGISGASGAANIAAATGAMNTAAGSTGAMVVPGLNALAGAYGAYQTAEATGSMAKGKQRDLAASIGGLGAGAGLGGAAAGAMYGAAAGPMGMLIGAGVGLLAGYAGSKFGSSKGKAQMTRDAIRSTMQEQGILGEDFKGTLADGSAYDFGKDGSTLKWKNIDKIAEANPSAWSPTVGLSDAMATAYGFVGQKASDISAWYAKAAVSNAGDDPEKAKQNMRHFAQQQGITFDMIKGNLDSALADNRISKNQYESYLNGARDLTAGMKPKAEQKPASTPPVASPPVTQAAAMPAERAKPLTIRDVLQRNMENKGNQ
jgi:hypothetical protein